MENENDNELFPREEHDGVEPRIGGEYHFVPEQPTYSYETPRAESGARYAEPARTVAAPQPEKKTRRGMSTAGVVALCLVCALEVS